MTQISHSSHQEASPRWDAFLDPLPMSSEILALWEEHFKLKRIKTRSVPRETSNGTMVELQIYRRWWVRAKNIKQ